MTHDVSLIAICMCVSVCVCVCIKIFMNAVRCSPPIVQIGLLNISICGVNVWQYLNIGEMLPASAAQLIASLPVAKLSFIFSSSRK